MPNELTISMSEVALRIGLAAILGLAIGFERERQDRVAGLRTHALVCLAASLVMIVSAYGFTDVLNLDSSHISLDPSRVAAQVVTGVGFLGAGVIIFRQNAIHGLTTAASLWAVAGIGLACGGGLLWPAALATAIILAIQAIIRPIEKRFSSKRQPHLFALELDSTAADLVSIENGLANLPVSIRHIAMHCSPGGDQARVDLELANVPAGQRGTIVSQLEQIDGVRVVEYQFGKSDVTSASATDDAGKRMMPGRRTGWWTRPVDNGDS